MSNGWSAKNYVESGLVAFGASVSSTPISKEFPLTAGGANRGLLIAIKASGVSGTCTATMQSMISSTSVATKAVVLANGYSYIKFNPATDSAYLPLLAKGQITLVTAAASGCTIEEVQVLQEL